MKKTVTIKIEVDMKSAQSEQWVDAKDYFEVCVKDTLDEITNKPIKNSSGKIETETEKSSFTVNVQTSK